MWMLVWVFIATDGPAAEPAAVFQTEAMCKQVAAILNLSKPSWGEYLCIRGGEE